LGDRPPRVGSRISKQRTY